MKKVYIAGPMRGYPRYNFDAFFAAEERIRKELGWDVISPARIDVELGFDPDIEHNIDRDMLNTFIKRDVDAICQCDAIVLLPGWEKSTGTKAEIAIALFLGMELLEYGDNIQPNSLVWRLRCKLDILQQLKDANSVRTQLFGHDIQDWSLPEWSNAVAGETGELCNLVKKVHRGDKTLEEQREAIGKEAADIVCYLDLFCQRAGIDLATAIVNKFNEVSGRIGSDIKLVPHDY
jgi:NTP pyrophosphatase (non-canonical NTP hydrolase)